MAQVLIDRDMRQRSGRAHRTLLNYVKRKHRKVVKIKRKEQHYHDATPPVLIVLDSYLDELVTVLLIMGYYIRRVVEAFFNMTMPQRIRLFFVLMVMFVISFFTWILSYVLIFAVVTILQMQMWPLDFVTTSENLYYYILRIGVQFCVGDAGTYSLIQKFKSEARNPSQDYLASLFEPKPDVRKQYEALESELLCPITLLAFWDPVVASDGYTYERSAILEWMESNYNRGNDIRSPVTNEALQVSLLGNKHLWHSIDECISKKLKLRSWDQEAEHYTQKVHSSIKKSISSFFKWD